MDVTKKIVSRDPEVMGGEIVFAGTRVKVKTLVDYLKGGHTLDDFLEGFPTSRASRPRPTWKRPSEPPRRSPCDRRPKVGLTR